MVGLMEIEMVSRSEWIMQISYLTFSQLFGLFLASTMVAYAEDLPAIETLLERLSSPIYESHDKGRSYKDLQFVSRDSEATQVGRLVQIDGVGSQGEAHGLFTKLGKETEDLEIPSLFEGSLGRVRLPKIRLSEHFRYTNYRSGENLLGVIPEKGDRFGMTTLESSPYMSSGYGGGINFGYAFHFLSGPQQIDLPSRLYQFSMGYQNRGGLSEFISYDGAATVTVNSDFEGSAREGVFFPGHLVGMLHATPEVDYVMGIDYLHRDDIKLLPVVGLSYHSDIMPNARLDLVFPRPKVQFGLPGGRMFYVAGRLGGGTWDFELPGGAEDVVTYRDYRILLGLARGAGKFGIRSIEVGYLFGRKLSLRESGDSMRMSDALAIQFVTLK